MTKATAGAGPGSWRDPFGFVYRRDGTPYRQVKRAAAEEWAALQSSGLLWTLQEAGLLVAHEPVELDPAASERNATGA